MSLGEPILYPQSRARTVTTPPGCFNALFCASARASVQFQLRRVFPPVSGMKAPLCLPDSCTALRSRPQSPFPDGRHQPPWLSRVVFPRTSKVRIFRWGRDILCTTSSPTASEATRTSKSAGQLSLGLLTMFLPAMAYFGHFRLTVLCLLCFRCRSIQAQRVSSRPPVQSSSEPCSMVCSIQFIFSVLTTHPRVSALRCSDPCLPPGAVVSCQLLPHLQPQSMFTSQKPYFHAPDGFRLSPHRALRARLREVASPYDVPAYLISHVHR